MPDQISGRHSVEKNWNIALRDDGVVTEEELNRIVGAARSDGRISTTEERHAGGALEAARESAANAAMTLRREADVYQEMKDAALQQTPGIVNQDFGRAIGEFRQMGDRLKAQESIVNNAVAQGQRSLANARHAEALKQRLAASATEFAVDARLPIIVDKLSYAAFLDWVITDGEAKSAAAQVTGAGRHTEGLTRALANRESGLYLKRLVDQLPSSSLKSLGEHWAQHLSPETKSLVQRTLGSSLWSSLTRQTPALR